MYNIILRVPQYYSNTETADFQIFWNDLYKMKTMTITTDSVTVLTPAKPIFRGYCG